MTDAFDPAVARMQARLVYDTKTQSLASGVRAVVQRGRRLLYAAAATELVLQITLDRRPDHVRLIGQVLDEGMPVEGATVDLHRESTAIHQATDDEGEFRVNELPFGIYDLDIETDMHQVSVEQLDLT